MRAGRRAGEIERTFHVPLTVEFEEGVSAGLVRDRVVDEADPLHGSVLLKLPPELRLGHFEADSPHEERLEEWSTGCKRRGQAAHIVAQGGGGDRWTGGWRGRRERPCAEGGLTNGTSFQGRAPAGVTGGLQLRRALYGSPSILGSLFGSPAGRGGRGSAPLLAFRMVRVRKGRKRTGSQPVLKVVLALLLVKLLAAGLLLVLQTSGVRA